MKHIPRLTALLFSTCLLGSCATSGKSPDIPSSTSVAYFAFDGNLDDASGKGTLATGDSVQFAEGHKGQAVKLSGPPLSINNSPNVQLIPGLSIDCWIYFDEIPIGYAPIVTKDNEYMLRVDNQEEGGRFSFFVYLNGWEPRISSAVPEVGKWHHVVATWTGSEATLEVDGDRQSAPRAGTAIPSEAQLFIGGSSYRIDELKLSKPQAAAI